MFDNSIKNITARNGLVIIVKKTSLHFTVSHNIMKASNHTRWPLVAAQQVWGNLEIFAITTVS